MKDVQQDKEGADTKNNQLESKNPVMKAKAEVPKETMAKGDRHMRNENGLLGTRIRVIKKTT